MSIKISHNLKIFTCCVLHRIIRERDYRAFNAKEVEIIEQIKIDQAWLPI